MPGKSDFVRNIRAGGLFESFLICAVVAVVGIRFFLALTGYPQLGGGGLHIAHMLWGGLGMLAAPILLLGFLGSPVRPITAVIGGLGFGTFIDELGKFITSDNNYFFQPTIALIYVLFVILFLIFRAIESRRSISQRECLANALDQTGNLVGQAADEEDMLGIHRLLQQCDPNDPLVSSVQRLVEQIPTSPSRRPGPVSRYARFAREFYRDLVHRDWFRSVVVGFFVIFSAISLVQTLLLWVVLPLWVQRVPPSLSVIQSLSLISSAITGVFVILGIVRMRHSRLSAYQSFRTGVLVQIFVTQFFNFYLSPLAALVGLVVSILTLVVLDYMIAQESGRPGDAPSSET